MKDAYIIAAATLVAARTPSSMSACVTEAQQVLEVAQQLEAAFDKHDADAAPEVGRIA